MKLDLGLKVAGLVDSMNMLAGTCWSRPGLFFLSFALVTPGSRRHEGCRKRPDRDNTTTA